MATALHRKSEWECDLTPTKNQTVMSNITPVDNRTVDNDAGSIEAKLTEFVETTTSALAATAAPEETVEAVEAAGEELVEAVDGIGQSGEGDVSDSTDDTGAEQGDGDEAFSRLGKHPDAPQSLR